MMLSGFLTQARESRQLFCTGEQTLTWQEACEQIESLAAELAQRKIACAALSCDGAERFAMALLACVVSGVNVCIPANLQAENSTWLSNTADVLLSDVPDDGKQLPSMPVILLQDAFKKRPVKRLGLDFQNNIQLSLQTSGSSGTAKIIQKSWLNMLAEAQGILAVLPKDLLSAPLEVLSSVSAQHLYGLSFRIVLNLLAGWCMDGRRAVYSEPLLAASAKLTQRKGVWVSSPTLLHALNEQHDFSALQGKIALIVSSGGALNASCKAGLMQKLSCPVLEIYGSTETGVVAYRNDTAYWHFFPNVRHQEVSDGLRIESSWCEPAHVLADAVAWHESGFELLGRLDRIIKLADKRISLLQMEACMLEHAWVGDVYIAPHPAASHLAAWVALNAHGVDAWRKQGRKAVIAALKQHLQGQTEAVALPLDVGSPVF